MSLYCCGNLHVHSLSTILKPISELTWCSSQRSESAAAGGEAPQLAVTKFEGKRDLKATKRNFFGTDRNSKTAFRSRDPVESDSASGHLQQYVRALGRAV